MTEEWREALDHAVASPQLAGDEQSVRLLRELVAANEGGAAPARAADSSGGLRRLRAQLYEYQQAHPNRRRHLHLPRNSAQLILRAPRHARLVRGRRSARGAGIWVGLLALVLVAAAGLGVYLWLRFETQREAEILALGQEAQIESYAVAPGGDMVVYADRAGAMWKTTVEGSAPERIGGDARGRYPAISPDGVRVAYWRGDSAELVERPLDGAAAETVLFRASAAGPLAWSPDGRAVYFAHEAALVYFELQSRSLRIVAANGAHPAVSAATRRLAFIRPNGVGRVELWVADLAGEKARRVAGPLAFFRGHAWSPDGRRIYFTGEHQGSRGLWKLSIDAAASLDAAIDSAPAGGASSTQPILARGKGGEGPRLFWLEREETRKIQRLELGKSWRNVELPKIPLGAPELSPDGKAWALRVQDSTRNALLVGPRNHLLTPVGISVESSPTWTPDGEGLLFVGRQGGALRVFSQSVKGGSPADLGACSESPSLGELCAASQSSLARGAASLALPFALADDVDRALSVSRDGRTSFANSIEIEARGLRVIRLPRE